MKKLTLISTLIFSVMFSSTSFAEWKKVSKNVKENTYYVDFERIRKHGGYVYFWRLSDYLKPSPQGSLSVKIYNQGDCKLFRFKILSASFHKEPMGGGTGDSVNPENPEWEYPPPESTTETVLKFVCSR